MLNHIFHYSPSQQCKEKPNVIIPHYIHATNKQTFQLMPSKQGIEQQIAISPHHVRAKKYRMNH